MSISITDIKKPFQKELDEYESTFRSIMSSNVSLIDTVVKYVVKNKGKGFRPLLVLMAAKLVGKPQRETYVVASIIELLHSASLIHDDVVDEALVRRHFPAINALWKNKIAVLMGDYLLSKCLIGATMTGNLQIMNKLALAAKRLSKGELNQIEKARKLSVSEEEYFEIISNKTAALISTASELGAMTASQNEDDSRHLRDFGENLGMAFQIKDDLLDYSGKQKLLGKPVGNDIKDKKITLPMIHAFNNAGIKEISKIKRLMKKGVNGKQTKYIIDFVNSHGGLEYAEQKQNEYVQKAKSCLDTYPDSEIRKSLYHFVDYTVQRTR